MGEQLVRALVYGGAGSGKSLYAETLACGWAGGNPLYYLATMELSDEESRARVLRHRRQRAGKRFLTLEMPRPQSLSSLLPGGMVLLEDLGNLCANTLFGPMPPADPLDVVDKFLLKLEARCCGLVVVSNDLFRDGINYDRETQGYLDLLARLHCRLAARYEQVTEIVCGLPITWKGEKL